VYQRAERFARLSRLTGRKHHFGDLIFILKG
jgi:hypothetical protein